MPDDRVKAVADLLHEAGEIHHTYFVDTDGSDDDWATFYSEWLLSHTPLPKIFKRAPVRSHLTSDLVICDEEYTKAKPTDPWPQWYATRLLAKYG